MKFQIIVALLFVVLTDFTNALAFTSHKTTDTLKIANVASPSRRDVFGCMLVAGVTTTTTGVMASFVQPASASGGATAGGAYLLSAKQRYNQRVRAALQAFVNLQSAVEDGMWGDIESYFVTTEVGGWNDGSSAGYLLANAFRRNSSAAPDTLPSVKKWKAFALAVEKFMKIAKKGKDKAGALEAYINAMNAMEGYLVEVDLPSAREL